MISARHFSFGPTSRNDALTSIGGTTSPGEFYDLSEDPLEKHDLTGAPAMNAPQARAERARLQRVLDSLPTNVKLPWEFRSISARKIRAEEEERRKHEQVRQKL